MPDLYRWINISIYYFTVSSQIRILEERHLGFTEKSTLWTARRSICSYFSVLNKCLGFALLRKKNKSLFPPVAGSRDQRMTQICISPFSLREEKKKDLTRELLHSPQLGFTQVWGGASALILLIILILWLIIF
jgi:hypothetical protein